VRLPESKKYSRRARIVDFRGALIEKPLLSPKKNLQVKSVSRNAVKCPQNVASDSIRDGEDLFGKTKNSAPKN